MCVKWRLQTCNCTKQFLSTNWFQSTKILIRDNHWPKLFSNHRNSFHANNRAPIAVNNNKTSHLLFSLFFFDTYSTLLLQDNSFKLVCGSLHSRDFALLTMCNCIATRYSIIIFALLVRAIYDRKAIFASQLATHVKFVQTSFTLQ